MPLNGDQAKGLIMNVLRRGMKLLFCRGKTSPIIEAVQNDSLTFLETAALNDLYEQVTRLEKNRVPGILIEAGCALGGSAIVIAAAKSESRPFYIYDVFGMIPPPADMDGEDAKKRYDIIKSGKSKGIGGQQYYGYVENLLDKVTENFQKHKIPTGERNIHLVKGLFQETMHIYSEVALAHIDSDWYESVKTCLERIEPHLISGGILVVDDYDSFLGCKTAVDEYFSDKKSMYKFVRRARLHITRK
jgi:hypothetical protein